jgi:hypothetical protein
MTKLHRLLFAGIVLSLATGYSTQAGTVSGSQSFADAGTATADTGNINTATSFTIGDMVSTGSQEGAFIAYPPLTSFGSISFSLSNPVSFSFGNGSFGSFTSTSISEALSTPGSVEFYILGNYTPGSFVGIGPAQPASFTLGFEQTPASTGSISDSGTFATPPAPPPGIPEPASVVLVGIGLTSVSLFRMLRKRMGK